MLKGETREDGLCRWMTPNIQLHRSVNSRLRRLSPPDELGRSASLKGWSRGLQLAVKGPDVDATHEKPVRFSPAF